jgi:hypothetical protein
MMSVKIIHFDEIKDKAIELLTQYKDKNIDYSSTVFIVRDVYGRISVYIDSPVVQIDEILKIKKILEEAIGTPWINTVEEVSWNSGILNQLKETTHKVTEDIYFGERHLTRLNWFREKLNIKKLQKTKVVTFYSFKGGLGRTTSLVMSALQLARKGKTVI